MVLVLEAENEKADENACAGFHKETFCYGTKMNPFAEPTIAAAAEPTHVQSAPAPRKKGASSSSSSRVPGMTVGDVRHSFCQLRANPHFTHTSCMWLGITAGSFSMRYLISSEPSVKTR